MFEDRFDAGRQLAEALEKYADQNPAIFAMPRGGVEVGYEVAKALNAPLDIVVVRKLGAPGQPELAAGAVVDGKQPEVIYNERVLGMLNISKEYLDDEIEKQLHEIDRRKNAYRSGEPPVPTEDATVIVVDDGIATGASVRAALHAAKRWPKRRLVLAVPVAPPRTVEELRGEVDDLVCLSAPEMFQAVGEHYRNFRQTSDEEVVELLKKSRN